MTRIAVLAYYEVNTFPELHFLAKGLAERGGEVLLGGPVPPHALLDERISLASLATSGRFKGLPNTIEWHIRAFRTLSKFRPDWIVADQELAFPALLYKGAHPLRRVKVASYSTDYYLNRQMKVVGAMASGIDAIVSDCSLRLDWRQRDWSRSKAEGFVIRHAPLKDSAVTAHAGAIPVEMEAAGPRIVFSSSYHVLLAMDRTRLGRFFARLCEQGINIDWYFFGEAGVREQARALLSHPRYRVFAQLPKAELLGRLPSYDVGLHWAPMADGEAQTSPTWKRYFLSAASNKVGEYIAAGLAVAYAGNPGLRYLPESLSVAFDPTDPEQGADQLAARLHNADWLKGARAAALRYHREEMNAEAQTAPLIRHILGEPAAD